jgi:hypothetical protein
MWLRLGVITPLWLFKLLNLLLINLSITIPYWSNAVPVILFHKLSYRRSFHCHIDYILLSLILLLLLLFILWLEIHLLLLLVLLNFELQLLLIERLIREYLLFMLLQRGLLNNRELVNILIWSIAITHRSSSH